MEFKKLPQQLFSEIQTFQQPIGSLLVLQYSIHFYLTDIEVILKEPLAAIYTNFKKTFKIP